ncbi:MAG: hypothetical protein IAE97_10895 [Chthoniobacterales bacterium]|nr:hypothetical protein [Chthoniobacterales bacterium]
MSSFLILLPFTLVFLGMAFALGTEPRILMERTGEQTFRVTGSNQIFGFRFYTKTIGGVDRVQLATAARNDRTESIQERQRRLDQVRLDFMATDGSRLSWGREGDSRMIDDFMRSNAPILQLVEPPPWWRTGLTWLCLVLAVLIFTGTIRNCFFAKPTGFSAVR